MIEKYRCLPIEMKERKRNFAISVFCSSEEDI